MRLDKQAKLFVGFMAEPKLRMAYEAVNSEQYVSDDGAGKYLTTLSVDGKVYLGKVVDGGLPTDRVEDVARNVLSILRRLLPHEKLPASLAIFALVD